MDKEWRELLEKELNLRAAFVKFNKFVKENHEKRERYVFVLLTKQFL